MNNVCIIRVKRNNTVDTKTKIMKGEEQKTFADLRMGDKVIVKYTKADAINIAKIVIIKPAEEKSEKK